MALQDVRVRGDLADLTGEVAWKVTCPGVNMGPPVPVMQGARVLVCW